MYRVCLTKDGKLIEMQSGGDDRPDLMDIRLNTLKQNAINAGYAEEDVEVKFIDDADLPALIEASKTPEQKTMELNAPVKARLNKIDLKSIRSLREWLVKQPDASAFIKAHESEAITERVKLTK